MSDSPGASGPAEARGDGVARRADPDVEAAPRPLSSWVKHISDQQWEVLVSHARVRLFEYPEQAEDLVQTILAEAADGRFHSAEVTRKKLLPFLKAVLDRRAWKVARGQRRRKRRESHPTPPPERGHRTPAGVTCLAPA